MITKKNYKFTTVSRYDQISERGNSCMMTVPEINYGRSQKTVLV